MGHKLRVDWKMDRLATIAEVAGKCALVSLGINMAPIEEEEPGVAMRILIDPGTSTAVLNV